VLVPTVLVGSLTGSQIVIFATPVVLSLLHMFKGKPINMVMVCVPAFCIHVALLSVIQMLPQEKPNENHSNGA
jgi:hypothetical protein